MYLLIFLQNSMIFEGSPNSLTGVLFHWKIKTGGVLIHQWITTGGVLNLGNLNSPLNQFDQKKSLDNALMKISIKGHDAFWKSRRGSNLLSTSHDLSSKYAYVCKPRAKFWLLSSLLVDKSTKFSNRNRYIGGISQSHRLSVTSQAHCFHIIRKSFLL